MNNALRIPTRFVLAALLIAALAYSERAFATMPEFGSDGWYSWRVQAAATDAQRCCGTWSRGQLISSGCNLDTGRIAPGCADLEPSDELQIYALVENGEVTRIHTFSPQCRIETTRKIRDLGLIENGDSVARLKTYVAPGSLIIDDALAAITSHAGDEAFEFVEQLIFGG